jgi:hypothetical protein
MNKNRDINKLMQSNSDIKMKYEELNNINESNIANFKIKETENNKQLDQITKKFNEIQQQIIENKEKTQITEQENVELKNKENNNEYKNK